jgi:hypothetical protein
LIGARPPHRIPTWIARMAIGEAGVSMMTKIRGASNDKAKRVLGWQPAYASWREGFRRSLSADPSLALTECGALEDVSGRLDAASRN